MTCWYLSVHSRLPELSLILCPVTECIEPVTAEVIVGELALVSVTGGEFYRPCGVKAMQ